MTLRYDMIQDYITVKGNNFYNAEFNSYQDLC